MWGACAPPCWRRSSSDLLGRRRAGRRHLVVHVVEIAVVGEHGDRLHGALVDGQRPLPLVAVIHVSQATGDGPIEARRVIASRPIGMGTSNDRLVYYSLAAGPRAESSVAQLRRSVA